MSDSHNFKQGTNFHPFNVSSKDNPFSRVPPNGVIPGSVYQKSGFTNRGTPGDNRRDQLIVEHPVW